MDLKDQEDSESIGSDESEEESGKFNILRIKYVF
jgi:hypothetical protein